MSALPPKADIVQCARRVHFVPKADVSNRSKAASYSITSSTVASSDDDLRSAKWGSTVSLHGSNPDPRMSALGQKRTFSNVAPMSALPPKFCTAVKNVVIRLPCR
jgi:hypothetical protein